MKLVSLDFDDEANPERVVVQMSRDEALFVAVFCGNLNEVKADEIMPGGGSEVCHGIYDCLVGSVFNRYWEDGVRDALRER